MPAFLYTLTHGLGEIYVMLDVCNMCLQYIYFVHETQRYDTNFEKKKSIAGFQAVRPNYFIFVGYLRKMRIREANPTPLYI